MAGDATRGHLPGPSPSKSQPVLNTSRYAASPSSSQPTTFLSQDAYSDQIALTAACTPLVKTTTTNDTHAATTALRTTAAASPFAALSPSTTAPLAVQVDIRFLDLNSQSDIQTYVNEYTSSTGLAATNRLCNGLLRRLHHCSTELITRKDSQALNQRYRQGQETVTKQLRYEIRYRILCRGADVWAEKAFCSYQSEALTDRDAYEVILATHRIIGLFLRRHDPSFYWTEAPITKTAAVASRLEDSRLVCHKVDTPLSLSCVPQARFLENSQSFEFTPGYAINFTFRSRCRGRKQYEWKRVVSLQSKQNAPLNLALAEDLLWDTFNSVNGALSARRKAFHEEHKACDFLEGVVSCQHFGEEAIEIELGIENRLGPNFSHLKRFIESKLGLFRDPDARDCQEFFLASHRSLVHARNTTDSQVRALPDFDLRIMALSAPTWSVETPARFLLGSTNFFSRQSVEAILHRVQTGVSDVLCKSSCTIHLVAYKRGHLVLDKALIARPLSPETGPFHVAVAADQADHLVTRLAERISLDLDAICKDTCSLDVISDNASNDDNLNQIDGSCVDSSLPQCLAPATSAHSAFKQTFIYPDTTAVEEEKPRVLPPRFVELPEDVFVDTLEPSHDSLSPALKPRCRAFPLVPKQFTMSHFRSSPTVHAIALDSTCGGTPAMPTNAPAVSIKTLADLDMKDVTGVSEDVCAIDPDQEVSSPDEENEPDNEVDAVPISRSTPGPVFGEETDSKVEKNLDAEPAEIDNITESISGSEKQLEDIMIDSPPMLINFSDFEEQPTPTLEHYFEPLSCLSIDQALETVFDYDGGSDDEFNFELPSYGHFISTLQEVQEITFNTRVSAAASTAVSQDFASHNIDKESYLGSIVDFPATSLDSTRPSTPSLSSSSGEVDSPESSLLETPNFLHGRQTAVTCFNSDESPDYDSRLHGGYGANSQSANSKHNSYGQLVDNANLVPHSLAGQSLFGQPLRALPTAHKRDSFESVSSYMESWQGFANNKDIHMAPENSGQLYEFDFDLKFSAGQSPDCHNFADGGVDAATRSPASYKYSKLVTGMNFDSEQQLFEDGGASQASNHNPEASLVEEIALHDFDSFRDQVNLIDLQQRAHSNSDSAADTSENSIADKAVAQSDAIHEFVADALADASSETTAEVVVKLEHVIKQDADETLLYATDAESYFDLRPVSLLDLGNCSEKNFDLDEDTLSTIGEMTSYVPENNRVTMHSRFLFDLDVSAAHNGTDHTAPDIAGGAERSSEWWLNRTVLDGNPPTDSGTKYLNHGFLSASSTRSIQIKSDLTAYDRKDVTNPEEHQRPLLPSLNGQQSSQTLEAGNCAVFESEVNLVSASEMSAQQANESHAFLDVCAAPTPALHTIVEEDVELGVASTPSSEARIISGIEEDLALTKVINASHLDQLPAPEYCKMRLVDDFPGESIGSIHKTVDLVDLTLPKCPTYWSLPRCGVLGLHQTRSTRFSLRGALPVPHVFDRNSVSTETRQKRAARVEEDGIDEAEDAILPSQLEVARPSLLELSNRTRSVSVFAEDFKQVQDTADATEVQQGMLPRVIIAFVSMAIMSQMINRSS
ncbi:hypothetical protein SEPCBS57363_001486 [Sporothrix epigloea]|uniref:Pt repeat family protein n=1 Tax=Sporothrix epigloea TaxID=1892477 RepID=A0ABP0DDJ9_9PEZI